ncbi:MAG: hypothetical protein PUF11_04090 [Parafannyhessea umbonata]|uniref:hypothetical protein n=1 Tax=Parafannyhessea umbonata TaxID=604330 RepID=UPI0026EF0772|nr:hypothetical protein [Parafannyhessea umbonata]MDD6565953.1 hypothetical protein [Parafannyhessea umbonata]
MAYAEFTPVSGGPTVRLEADKEAGLMLGTVAGWYGTPSAKVDMTERAGGDGSFPVSADGILYSARTVTLGVCASGDTYAEMVERMGEVGALSGRMVELIIDGDDGATYATGYVQAEWDEGPMAPMDTGTLTIVCPDPRRYGTTPHRAYLSPGASAGALAWHADAPHGLAWPLSYGDGGAVANVATLRNEGTSAAYPTITASGDMDGLVITDTATGAQLAWDGHVGAQPVTLDCLSRAASVAGVDASRLLSSRGFPSVPPGGEVTLALSATGSGTVCVEWRDTYI